MPVNNLMTISRPEDLPSTGALIDRNMAGVTQANKDYAQYGRDVSLEEKPFQTIGGPTAADVNSGANRMGTFEFLARGGIDNTAKSLANNIWEKRRKKEQMAQFEQLLTMQEKGGQLLYDDAVKTYGEQIKEWIPPTSFFFDQETGAFMPYKYAERVAYGITAYEKALAKAQQMQTIGNAMVGAENRQDAAAGVIGAGGEVKDYKDAIETIPKTMDAKEISEIDKNKEMINTYKTEQDKNKAMSGYYNRMPKADGSGGKPKTPQENINQLQGRILQYEGLIKGLQSELRDPNRNPDAEADTEIGKKIKTYERAIGELKRDIDREKAKVEQSTQYTPPSAESYATADELYNSIYQNVPEGYTVDDQAMEVMDDQGNVQPGMYDEAVLSRVLHMMDMEQIKLPQLGPTQGGRAALIKKSIRSAGLKETIDALLQLKAGGAQ